MDFNNIEDICTGLTEKAKSNHFLQHPREEVKDEVNKFVESFSMEHGMHSHAISPQRWSFESEKHMFEDGVIELHCDPHLKNKNGACEFLFVDVSNAKLSKKKK